MGKTEKMGNKKKSSLRQCTQISDAKLKDFSLMWRDKDVRMIILQRYKDKNANMHIKRQKMHMNTNT